MRAEKGRDTIFAVELLAELVLYYLELYEGGVGKGVGIGWNIVMAL